MIERFEPAFADSQAFNLPDVKSGWSAIELNHYFYLSA